MSRASNCSTNILAADMRIRAATGNLAFTLGSWAAPALALVS